MSIGQYLLGGAAGLAFGLLVAAGNTLLLRRSLQRAKQTQGTVMGTSGSIAGVWILARKMDDTIPAEGVEVPDAETIELPEDAAQESTPDTDPADERRDDTNG